MVRRLLDSSGQFLDILKAQPALVGPAVQDLQGGNFVAVIGQELLRGLFTNPSKIEIYSSTKEEHGKGISDN